ncbi:MAG: putative toxin-antitoxin system toxin component, PIN family [Burkholderiaceae bacterium]|nr:putative toxin-antitoxin system toxin component, PIN family [Roseateles sp.]MBV8471378.1 putative toxin-antitoxin system toxin component, PIN family [Burkholderiaceae bacterium]
MSRLPEAATPRVVIDTQTVMDWLVFKEPSVMPLAHALSSGELHWLGHPTMLEELLHVLGRGVAASRNPDIAAILAVFAAQCRQIEALPPRAPRLVCRDADDQIFIDLALAHGARWLISRDRAVLALAKRAKPFGLEILSAPQWVRLHATPAASET